MCWLSLCLCSAALPTAAAQPSAARVVLLSGSAIADEDFDVLQGALAKLDAELVRVQLAPPPCEPDGASVEPGVRVWVSWQPDRTVQLCFEDRSGRHARTLGPFASLRGSAREQLMTVIESGLQAAEAAETELAARAAPVAPALPPPAAEPKRATLTLALHPALGLGLTSWSRRAPLTTHLDAAFGVSWLERALAVRAELGFTPAFTVTSATPKLGLQAQSWRVGLSASQSFPLYARSGGLIALGAALEHVRIEPEGSAASLRSRVAVSHTDPLMFARVGPTLDLGAHFELSIALGAELLFQPRRYGFTVGDTNQAILDLARVRASVLAEISAAL